MIRFPLSMAMLAMYLVALKCTASDPDLGKQGDTRDNGGGGGGGGGGASDGLGDVKDSTGTALGSSPEVNSAGTARNQAEEEVQELKEQEAQLTVTTTTAKNKPSDTNGGTDTGNPVRVSSPASPDITTVNGGSEGSSTSSSSVTGVVNKTAVASGPASSLSGVSKLLGTPSIPAPHPTSGTPSSSGTASNPPTGDNRDGSHAPIKPAVTTDANNGSHGTVSTAGSTTNTPTGGNAANTPLGSSGVPLSPSPISTAGNGGSSTQSGLARETGDRITDSSSDKLRDQNKDQLQDNAGNQAKNNASQNQGNTGSSPTSSELTGADKQTQEQNVSPASKPQKQSEKDTSTSEDVHQKGDTTNNNKQQTRGQGNAGTPTVPKTVSNVPPNKGATKNPKPEPILTTDTGSKINSTITTTMAEDVQPKSNANETSKTPTTTLAKQTNTLGQLQTLDKNDGTSSTSLLFAFATLVTLALVSVVSVS